MKILLSNNILIFVRTRYHKVKNEKNNVLDWQFFSEEYRDSLLLLYGLCLAWWIWIVDEMNLISLKIGKKLDDYLKWIEHLTTRALYISNILLLNDRRTVTYGFACFIVNLVALSFYRYNASYLCCVPNPLYSASCHSEFDKKKVALWSSYSYL